ncbi:MAG: hypothetical protein GXO55_05605, partial [Chloroflexi bacterium]|nr:hypothetical protein [Chloroflexota bacterium]
MAVSYVEQAPLTCPECGHEFTADIWLIVHAAERPDLIEHARDGTLHRITCPHCGHTVGEADVPLLIFTPPDMGTHRPPLLFSPAQQTTAEQDREHANALVGMLRERLGNAWRDEWTEQAQIVPRALLALALADDPEAEMRRLAEEAAQAIERLREEDPDAYRQLE